MSYNYSLYSIPAAWVVSMVPKFIGISVFDKNKATDATSAMKSTGRDQLTAESCKAGKLSPRAAGMVERLGNAHQNQTDNLGLFAACVVAGNAAGLPASTLNKLSFAYIGIRFVYNFVYMYTSNPDYVFLRTLTFFSGLGCCFTLLIKSAANFNKLRLA